MANTGNTQQQINYGAAANDGQGDPLRTAFIKTDDNFDAIWNTGPVGSNITILNNTIQSNNTNGNIVLRPNGVGMIQANAAIVPNATNLRDLGSAGQRFRAAYIGTGGLSVDGNVTVTGNLTAGNISYTGNVFVGDLQGSVYADDSTIMVDAVDNEMFAAAATFGRANISGNVAANYFVGNGSLLTGITSYSNANVVSLLANFGSNIISTTGNVTGNFVAPGGNGQVLYNRNGLIGASPFNFNFDESTFTLFVQTLSASGNVNNGRDAVYAGVPGVTPLGSDVIMQAYGNAAAYSQINMENISDSPEASGDFIITADNGTDTTHFVNIGMASSTWNGSQPNSLGANVGPNDGYMYTQDGNLVIGVKSGVSDMYLWRFTDQGISGTGNITAGYVTFDNGDGVIGPVSDDMVISWDNEEIRVVSVGGSIEMQADAAFRVQTNYDGANVLYASRWEFSNNELVNISGNFGIVSEAGNLNLSGGRDGVNSGNTTISAVDVGVAVYDWTFANNGDLNLPSEGNIVGMTPNNAGRLQWVGNSSGDGNGYTTIQIVPDETVFGNDQYLIIDPTGGSPGHIHIRAGGTQDNSSADLFLGGENSYVKLPAGPDPNVQIAANTHVWTFGSAGAYGELTLPAGEGAIRTIDDTLALVSFNTTTGNANSVYLGSSGGLGFYDQEIGGNWLEIFRSGAEPEIRVPVGRGNLNIQTAEGANVYNWTFDNTGNLTVPGNISTSGNILAGNVSANVAGFAIGYRDIPQVAFTGNATIAAADAGKHFYSTESTNYVLTIADNSSVSWPVGTAITVVNRGTGNITVAQASGVSLYLAGNSTAGNRTVSTYGMATVLNVAANVWMINGTGVA